MEKNTDKVQKGNSQTNEKHTVGQSVKLSISNEGGVHGASCCREYVCAHFRHEYDREHA